jgi:hypothetical protein
VGVMFQVWFHELTEINDFHINRLTRSFEIESYTDTARERRNFYNWG